MATTGQLACSAATEDASNGSSITINNLANLADGDAATACDQNGNGTPSRWVVCAFVAPSPPIPTGSTINGFTFRPTAWRSGPNAGNLVDFKATLAGSISGTQKGAISLTTSHDQFTIGGPTDKHGLTPTAAEINAGLLGCAFTMSQTVQGGARVGAITMDVHFTAPAAIDPPNGQLYLV